LTRSSSAKLSIKIPKRKCTFTNDLKREYPYLKEIVDEKDNVRRYHCMTVFSISHGKFAHPWFSPTAGAFHIAFVSTSQKHRQKRQYDLAAYTSNSLKFRDNWG